jgi:hypothetical protein
MIPEHYKEVTVRLYCRSDYYVPEVQNAFRVILNRINEKINQQDCLLKSDSFLFPESQDLTPESPDFKRRRVVSVSSISNPSPKKRLEINDALSIPVGFEPSPLKRKSLLFQKKKDSSDSLE